MVYDRPEVIGLQGGILNGPIGDLLYWSLTRVMALRLPIGPNS
jgi:hypothetical protein